MPRYSAAVVMLVPMTFGEKVRQFELSRRSFAGERAAADGIDVDEAERQLDDLIERLLPQGFETNAVARRLYESKGFVISNEEPGNIYMSKDLEGA